MNCMINKKNISALYILFIIAILPAIGLFNQDESESNDNRPNPQVNLRSLYKDFSVSEIESIPDFLMHDKDNWGFFGHSTIKHNYEPKTINGDRVVIDHATGLMWHQFGAMDDMNWNKAKQWVDGLNSRGYAGYSDWRLPTVEEAASLVESEKKNGVLYIDSAFYSIQAWIWTGDKCGPGKVWSVNYKRGHIAWHYIVIDSYVRPVRLLE